MDTDELLALIDERATHWQTRGCHGRCARCSAVLAELGRLRKQLTSETDFLMTRSGAYGRLSS